MSRSKDLPYSGDKIKLGSSVFATVVINSVGGSFDISGGAEDLTFGCEGLACNLERAEPADSATGAYGWRVGQGPCRLIVHSGHPQSQGHPYFLSPITGRKPINCPVPHVQGNVSKT